MDKRKTSSGELTNAQLSETTPLSHPQKKKVKEKIVASRYLDLTTPKTSVRERSTQQTTTTAKRTVSGDKDSKKISPTQASIRRTTQPSSSVSREMKVKILKPEATPLYKQNTVEHKTASSIRNAPRPSLPISNASRPSLPLSSASRPSISHAPRPSLSLTAVPLSDPQLAPSTMKDISARQDEVALLQIKVMQWCLANALAESSFKTKQQQAEKILYHKWLQASQLRDEVNQLKRTIDQLEFNSKLNEALDIQYKGLASFEELGAFLTHYDKLCTALYSTMHRLPTRNVTADMNKLNEALAEMSGILESLTQLIQSHESLSRLPSFAQSLQMLSQVVEEECSELLRSKELLSALTSLENQQRSMRIQRIQELEQPNNIEDLDSILSSPVA